MTLTDLNKKRSYTRVTDRKAVLVSLLGRAKWQRGHIKVVYRPAVFNDARFANLTDAKWYLREFTNGKLVKEFTDVRH
jgi:hypothetical protein